MVDIRPAAARYETVQPGITTWHCFSSGVHYDPANTAFGALIAVDEHVVAPGAGFEWHTHRGVEIVSWVLAGTLRHEDATGRAELVVPGTALHQSAGSGVEHAERNASYTAPLRFVQLVALGGVATPGYLLDAPPVLVGGGEFDVLVPGELVELAAAEYLHLFVVGGTVAVAGRPLQSGDSARIRDMSVTIGGDGGVLVWCARY